MILEISQPDYGERVQGSDDYILKLKQKDGEIKTVRLSRGELYYNYPWVKDAAGIITTNYTPCVEWFVDEVPISFINGSLSCFEFPYSLEVVNCIDNQERFSQLLHSGQIYFPFIMGTTCVKPIIHPVQIAEYSKAVHILEETHTLVVIGHSLLADDTHILTLIRNWLVGEKTRRLIYCNHINNEQDFQNLEPNQSFLKKLRFVSKKGQVHFINFSEKNLLEPELRKLL